MRSGAENAGCGMTDREARRIIASVEAGLFWFGVAVILGGIAAMLSGLGF